MCIICNCGEDGNEFLNAFDQARHGIKASKVAMLRCSQTAQDTAARTRYSTMHKKIAHLLRKWNSIEHERELDDEVHISPMKR